MKIIPIVFTFLLFINVTIAQNTSFCDSLVFQNGNSLSVSIDSIAAGKVFYKICPQESPLQRKTRLKYVKEVYKSELNKDSVVQKIALEVEPEKIKLSPVKKWVFERKAKKMMRSLSEGQSVKVKYRHTKGKIGTKTIKGKLLAITKTQMVMKPHLKDTVYIEKEMVDRINGYKTKENGGTVLGGIALVGGVAVGIVFGILLLSLVIVITSGIASPFNNKKERDRTGNGCLIATLLVIAGVTIIAGTGPKHINDPFTSDWEISESVQQLDAIKVEETKGNQP